MNHQDQQWQLQQDELRRREQAEQLERERLERLEGERLERDQEKERERQEKLDQHDHDSRRDLEDATQNRPGLLRTLMQILFARKGQSPDVEKQNVEPVFSSVADQEAQTQSDEAVTDFFAEHSNQPHSDNVPPAPAVSKHQIAPSSQEKKAYPWKLILALLVIASLALSWKYLFDEPVVEPPTALSAAEPSLAEIEDQVSPLEDEQASVFAPSPTATTPALDSVQDTLTTPPGEEPLRTEQSAQAQDFSVDLGETFPASNETAQSPTTVLPHDIDVQIAALQRDIGDIKQLLNDLMHQTPQLTVHPAPEPEPEIAPVAEPAPVKKPVVRRIKPAPKPSVRLVSVDMWDGKPSVVVASTRAGDNQTLVMRPGDTVNGVTLQSASATERSASFLVNGKTTRLTVEGQ